MITGSRAWVACYHRFIGGLYNKLGFSQINDILKALLSAFFYVNSHLHFVPYLIIAINSFPATKGKYNDNDIANLQKTESASIYNNKLRVFE